METIIIQYLDDTIERLKKIDKGDWIDLRSAYDYVIPKGELAKVHLGVAMKLPEGYEAHIVPRGSTYKNFGIIQTNHMGVVDNSYSGPNDWWFVPMLALRDNVKIKKGERICQFRIVEKQPEIDFVEGKLQGEDRGGFGSTGTN